MLIILRGPPGSGKSTFARSFFQNHQIVSTDNIREILFDDVNFMNYNDKVFELRNNIVRERLTNGLVTVADSMHLRPSCVYELIDIANELYSDYIIISFNCNNSIDLYKSRLNERNKKSEQSIPLELFDKFLNTYNNSNQYFHKDFGDKFIEVSYEIESEKIKAHHGLHKFIYDRYIKIVDLEKFDYWAIGDIHACAEELGDLISECINESKENNKEPVFYSVGDIIDRGNDPIGVYKLCKDNNIQLIQGNHEDRYIKEFITETAFRRSKDRVITHEAIKDDLLYSEFIKYIGSATHLILLIDPKTNNCICLSHPGIKWNYIEKLYESALFCDLNIIKRIPGKIHYYKTMDEIGTPSVPNIKQIFGHRYHQYFDNIDDNININIDSGVVFGNYITAINMFSGKKIKIFSRINTMKREFIKFPSISSFKDTIRHIRSNTHYCGKDDNGEPILDLTKTLPIIEYCGTVKIHGTNASIVLTKEKGEFWAQSRNRILTVENDNYGFAAFVHSLCSVNSPVLDNLHSKYFDHENSEWAKPAKNIVIYGEWCGPGIQHGVGVSKLKQTIFVVFGILVTDIDDVGRWISNEFVEGWNDRIFYAEQFGKYSIGIDFNNPANVQNALIQHTEDVENECPVAKYFGESGIGEGLVWKPHDLRLQDNPGYWFKVKGEKHAGSKDVKVLVPINAEKLESLNDFVDSVLTEGRLKQGLDYLREMGKPLTKQSTGDYIKWVLSDVIKEHYDVMQASYIEPKDINATISIRSRNWFFGAIEDVTQ